MNLMVVMVMLVVFMMIMVMMVVMVILVVFMMIVVMMVVLVVFMIMVMVLTVLQSHVPHRPLRFYLLKLQLEAPLLTLHVDEHGGVPTVQDARGGLVKPSR